MVCEPAQTDILIADDEELIRTLLTHVVEGEGCAIATAGTGKAVLEFLEHRQPRLILLDINMPELDGLEVLRRLRDDPRTADLPVVVLTGLSDSQTAWEAYNLGVRYFLTKPIDLKQVAALAQQIRAERASDEWRQQAEELIASE